ncbi:MAG: BACON domain-containing protein [Bacteroidaceae bacterium]|nr:BACON domain-containing protein [Bacteroidaceae bacterium]
MKKYLLFLACTLLYIACGGDDDGGGTTPSGGSEYLNVQNVDIPGGNTTATLSIQASSNCEWNITWTENWIRSISPTTGRGSQNATITVTTNPSSSTSRTAVVTVSNKGGTIKRDINVTQSPSSESLALSVTSLNFTYTAGSQTVTVTGNTQWNVVEADEEWFSVSPKTSSAESTVVTINVTENTSDNERKKVLTFKGNGGTSKQLEIIQAVRPTDFSVTPTNISADAPASTVTFNIVGEARWTAQSNQSWATLSDVSDTGNKTITVSLSDNTNEQDRTAEITVSSSSKSEKVTITQAAGTKPTITEVTYSDVTQTTATISFKYNSMFPVKEYGICCSSTNQEPTLESDAHKSETGSAKQGSPSIPLSDLAPGTTYYIRTYATSAVGTQYSNTISFTTNSNVPGGGDNVTPNV